MDRTLLYVLALTPGIALSAVQNSTGSPGEGLRGHTGPQMRAGELVQRYVIPHVRSAQFSTGVGGRVTTVITATNGGAIPCDVAIDFHFAFNSDAAPECTVNLTLAPLLAAGSDTVNVCSRAIAGDRWTLCTATCSPDLSFMQGKAVVRAGPSCAADLALDARLYHSDTNDDVLAVAEMDIAPDLDGDGSFDANDNCTAVANPAQRDTDNDGIGNICDQDLNQDCTVDLLDLSELRVVFLTADADADFNGDGTVDLVDLSIFRNGFLLAPGPSGVPNECP